MSARAEFLKKSLKIVAGAMAHAVEARLPEQLKAPMPLRPPGAGPDLAEKCNQCGDCIPVCPEGAIALVVDELSGLMLPAIIPSIKACTMCEDLPCIKACDPEALALPADNRFPRMGTARIIEDHCLSYTGGTCVTCFDACPLKRRAIRIQFGRPIINADECTGCGICEEACILDGDKGVIIEAA